MGYNIIHCAVCGCCFVLFFSTSFAKCAFLSFPACFISECIYSESLHVNSAGTSPILLSDYHVTHPSCVEVTKVCLVSPYVNTAHHSLYFQPSHHAFKWGSLWEACHVFRFTPQARFNLIWSGVPTFYGNFITPLKSSTEMSIRVMYYFAGPIAAPKLFPSPKKKKKSK